MESRKGRPRSGYTVIELLIVVSLLSVVGIKGVIVYRQASDAVSRSSNELVLEDQARLVVDRIAYAILGAEQDSLDPHVTIAPLHARALSYRVSLGVEEGEPLWDDPELITFLAGERGNQVVWVENPGEAGERRVVWSNLVRDLLEGEEVNGFDDNGNGLVDEEGLSFVVEGSRVTVRLSLGSRTRGVAVRTVETAVTCRNR